MLALALAPHAARPAVQNSAEPKILRIFMRIILYANYPLYVQRTRSVGEIGRLVQRQIHADATSCEVLDGHDGLSIARRLIHRACVLGSCLRGVKHRCRGGLNLSRVA
jgi:hypothetical protein